MKILLIQPPFTILKTETKKCHPPLGLAYLAAVLKDKFKVKVLDCLADGFECEEDLSSTHFRYGLSYQDIEKVINEYSPDVVGISCLFSAQAENVYEICTIAKHCNKQIATVLGGTHPSTMPEEALSNINVDFVIIGEAEAIMPELLSALSNKSTLSEILGVGFKDNGIFKINPRRPWLQDLDALPFPYWEIFPLKRYAQINNPHGRPARRVPFLPVITSRGCPFECVFCSVHNLWGKEYRKRSPENILKELRYLSEKFGVKEILFEDDNLTLDKERSILLFNLIISNSLDMIWSTPNGVAAQTLDAELLVLMKKSGCYAISLGVESGDEYILHSLVKKPVDLLKIKFVVGQARKLGFETAAFFVVGFPGENKQQLKKTFDFARRLGVDNVNLFFATPLPGTRLLELCREKGLVKGKINYMFLKSDEPYCGTGKVSRKDLDFMVKQERLKIHFLNLLLHPCRTLAKVFDKLIRDPGYFLRFGSKNFI